MQDPKEWVGLERHREERIDPWPVAAFNAALNRSPEVPADGTLLPACWHWLYFRPLYRAAASGPDGHERLGEFLPALPGNPQRMWAGSRITVTRPLQVGEHVRLRSTIANVAVKEGRSGKLVFVTVLHSIRGDAGGWLDDEQDIVYRDVGTSSAPPAPPSGTEDDWTWRSHWKPDSLLLFRYSALTYNSHRIHYDYPYCVNEEGYPGLVVHGPLLATLMFGLAEENLGRPLSRLEYRSQAPVFSGTKVTAADRVDGDGALLWVTREDGTVALRGSAK